MFYSIFIPCNIVIGYLFGSLSWSIIIGKVFFKKDLREYNSKNAGATNSMRVYGKKTAFVILILDICKTVIPAIIIWAVTKYCYYDSIPKDTMQFNPLSIVYLSSLFAIIGHCYPLFFKFKGGKGAASFGAFLWIISPWIAIICLLVFVLLIKKSKMVSFAAISTCFLPLFLMFIPGINYFYILENDITQLFYFDYTSYYSLLFLLVVVLISIAILLIKHRENIQRIVNKEERKIEIKSKKI